MRDTQSPRHGRLLLLLGLLLLVLFAALSASVWEMVRETGIVSDPSLVKEIAYAKFLADAKTDGWPQWRGVHRDGVTSMPDILREWPANGPPQLWETTIGKGYSSFSVSSGRAYTMFASDEQEVVVCLDLANGKEVWRHSEPGKSAHRGYPGPRATPTIDGERLYTLTSVGKLLCLKKDDGKVVWEDDLVKSIGAVSPEWGFACSPLVEGDLVYVAAGGTEKRCLAAFNKNTGALAWASEDDPAGYSSPVAVTVAGVRQIVFFTGKRVVGVTADEGKLLWEYRWNTRYEVNAATPLIVQALPGVDSPTCVFISSGYNKGCALLKIDSLGGGKFEARAVHQSKQLCCHFASPVRYEDHIYALDESRELTCLDLRTGKVAWRAPGFFKGTVLRVDNLLIVLGESGKLALVEANPKQYQEVASFNAFSNSPCWTLPVLAEGKLLLRYQETVKCLDMRKK